MHKQEDFTIIVDSREQLPWEFGFHTTSRQKLDTGDYTIQGLENIFTIERKMSVSEIATNITENRFKNVLNRLSQIPHAYIIMEFNTDDVYNFPVGSDIPKKLWDKLRIKGNYIMKILLEASINHNIHLLFCDDPSNAERTAISLIKRIYEKYGQNQNNN
jgi:ERCC4-type nuclease